MTNGSFLHLQKQSVDADANHGLYLPRPRSLPCSLKQNAIPISDMKSPPILLDLAVSPRRGKRKCGCLVCEMVLQSETPRHNTKCKGKLGKENEGEGTSEAKRKRACPPTLHPP